MAKRKVKKKYDLNFLKILLILAVVLGVILVFTAIDAFFHSLNIEYGVPSYYFSHKIIYGTIIGFLAYIILRKKKPLIKSVLFSAIISVLLQINYFIQGYSLDFVLIFLVIHFLILVIISSIAFSLLKKL